MKFFKGLLVVLIVTFIIMFGIAVLEGFAKQEFQDVIIKTTIPKMSEQFKANGIKANSLYRCKILEVEGIVDDMWAIGDYNNVVIKSSNSENNQLEKVSCELDTKSIKKAINLKKGDKIVIDGKFEYNDDVSGFIEMKHCNIK